MDDGIPPPPYHVSDVRMIFVGVRFDADSIRYLLPGGLEPVAGHTGTYCIYTAGYGWGIAPYSACFVAIEVQGFDSPDGSPGYYMATGHFSDRAGIVMRRDYNTNFLEGGGRLKLEDGLFVGNGGPTGIDALTIQVRPSIKQPPPTSGIHHYLGCDARGETTLYAVAYTGEIWNAEPISIEVNSSAGKRLQIAKPVELLWAFDCRKTSLTFSAPRAASTAPAHLVSESTRAGLLSLFAGIGRAAILVGDRTEVVVMNREAEELLEGCLAVLHGRLRACRSSDQVALARIVNAAIQPGAERYHFSPIGFERANGPPLIAQAIPVDPGVIGRPAAMVVLSDPGRETNSNLAPALRLLGLTSAEARMAVLVGSGQSPREAAEALDVTEHTARTYLKIIYDKLGISKRSELARIVTRLESLGT